MPKVVGIRFREGGKSYHFDPVNFQLKCDDFVIVETVKGVEIGKVTEDIIEIPDAKLHAPLKKVMRIANEKDILIYEEHKACEQEAFPICVEKILARGLEMNLVDVEYSFDGSKITFYFTADGRVDFRDLVKDLASVFRKRIELRQIGVRDEAKMIGGLGVCGRELCCSSFLTEFAPVSIKMAKSQNLSMNPAKISGACGRLLCCLKYEHEAYKDAQTRVPKTGTIVKTEKGGGVVVATNLLKETVTVRMDQAGEMDYQNFKVEDITFTKQRNRPKGKKPPKKKREKGKR